MSKKTVSAELTSENETTVLQNLDGATGLLPFLVELTSDDRKRMYFMSRKRLDFMERGLRYAQENPQLVPSYLDLTEFERDVALRAQLYRVFDRVNTLHKGLKDTLSVLESEAYEIARAFYAAVKVAAKRGEQGAENISKDLLYHYKQQKSQDNSSKPQEPGTTETQQVQAA